MVDLVKIRRKAKEKKDAEAVMAAASAETAAGEAPATRTAHIDVPHTAIAVNEPPKLARFLETAGERHAADSKKKSKASEAQQELLTFAIAGEQYAIGIERVVEIITPRPITRVPNAGASLVGILSLRGAIVALIDVRGRLGHPSTTATTAETRVIVVEHNDENVGFLVDRVLRVVKVAEETVEPQPIAHASEQDISVRGVFRHGTALTILLDLENLLSNGTGL
ncbi:MAG: chemotaxis protein CheW [Thermoanaerobaculia bacterium]|nr:chemotaxis protein CheW [Thermoanaerobaculia bacterium]